MSSAILAMCFVNADVSADDLARYDEAILSVTCEPSAELSMHDGDTFTKQFIPMGPAKLLSGFRIGSPTRIVTRLDAVQRRAKRIQVSEWRGVKHDANVVAFDDRTGLTVLETEESDSDKNTVALELAGQDPQRGESARLMWKWANHSNVVVPTTVLSAPAVLNSLGDRSVLLQGDMSEQAMGAPLLNQQGRVVGVFATTLAFTQTEAPVAVCQSVVARLLKFVDGGGEGRLPRAMLGVAVKPNDQHVIVTEVIRSAEADKVTLQSGDIIREVEGKPVDSFETLLDILASYTPGVDIEVKVVRDEAEQTITTSLIGRPAGTAEPTAQVFRPAQILIDPKSGMDPKIRKRIEEGLNRADNLSFQYQPVRPGTYYLSFDNLTDIAPPSGLPKSTAPQSPAPKPKPRAFRSVIAIPKDVNQRLDELSEKIDSLTKMLEERASQTNKNPE